MTKKYQEAIDLINFYRNISPETIIIDTHDKVISHNLIPVNTINVFNVDFHNDITITNHPDYKEIELDEGTWGNFLPKSVKNFIWMFPSTFRCIKQQYGICIPASKNPSDYPFNYTSQLGYSNLPKNINRLVICISQNWANPAKILDALHIPNWHKIHCQRF
jgi:hypothetical protein